MRATRMAILLALLASPATAAPIIITLEGTVTGIERFGTPTLFPDLSEGQRVAGTLTFDPDADPIGNRWDFVLTFTSFAISGWGVGAPSNIIDAWEHIAIFTAVSPSIATVTLMEFVIGPGWHSGSWSFFGETGATPVTIAGGTFDAIRAQVLPLPQSVPEPAPATLLLFATFVIACSRFHHLKRRRTVGVVSS